MKISGNELVQNKTQIDNLESFNSIKISRPFSDDLICFLDDLSKTLFKDPRIKQYPDVTTFAFFCRKGNILNLKKDFFCDEKLRLGRGMIFHIAPSNVPINFAYSLISGLLAGNKNIVRLPTKDFEQINIIIDALDQIYETGKYPKISNQIILIRYDADLEEITESLSSACSVRVIWGGDETISNVRRHKLPARSFDLTFADRYSICVIEAKEILSEKKLTTLISGFYNDTYLFDQNACTAPHLLVWLGNSKDVKKAQNLFWSELEQFTSKKYSLQNMQVMEKIKTFYSHAISEEKVKLQKINSNILWRISLNKLENSIEDFKSNGGYFCEYHAKSLSELNKIISPKYQTIAYHGLNKEKFREFIYQNYPNGIDRIVPVGFTTNFSLLWDGYNLIESLSRIIDFKE